MNDDPKKMEKGIKEDLKNYKKLERINDSDEFNDFFRLQIDTATQKMLNCFTGEGPKNWEEFCKTRGEVVAYLYPIQQVRGAEAMKKHLSEQLNNLYNKQAT